PRVEPRAERSGEPAIVPRLMPPLAPCNRNQTCSVERSQNLDSQPVLTVLQRCGTVSGRDSARPGEKRLPAVARLGACSGTTPTEMIAGGNHSFLSLA